MEKKDCFYLGKITKTVGFKGELIAFIDADDPEYYKKIDSVFLNIKGNLIPYFIEKIGSRNKSNQMNFKFQDVDTDDSASALQGVELFLPLKMLPPLSGNRFYFHEIEGYEVHDHLKGNIGKVQQVLDYPGNPLFDIVHDSKQILIPINDNFVKKLDRNQKIIHIEAPEGLIDIYLNEEHKQPKQDQ